MSEKIIMYDDPNIVEKKMVDLWVVKGKNYGFNSEHNARQDAATHVKCEDCGAPIDKRSYKLICSDCMKKRIHAKFLALPCEELNGQSFFVDDKYYEDLDSFLDDCFNDEIIDIEDVDIYSAEPCEYRQLDIYDYLCDSLPSEDEVDLPEEIIAAADALNAVLKTAKPVCFERGRVRYKLPSEIIEKYKEDFVAMGDI
jgi:hypothetical protein